LAGVIPPGYPALGHNWCMAEILWHRRETRRQTDNTNVMPVALGGLILLDKSPSTALARGRDGQPPDLLYKPIDVALSMLTPP